MVLCLSRRQLPDDRNVVLLIAVAAVVIDRFLIGLSIPLRFAAALLFISALALPIESWLIVNGYRVYGRAP